MHEVTFYGMDGRPITRAEGLLLLENVERRRVAISHAGGYEVSTVLLVIDHGFLEEDRPLIFETMIFGEGPLDGERWRYPTLEEAKEGHQHALDLAGAGHVPWRKRIRLLGRHRHGKD